MKSEVDTGINQKFNKQADANGKAGSGIRF